MRQRRVRARRRIMEQTAAVILMEGDAEAIGVSAGPTGAMHETSEAEAQVGRDVGAHTQQLAHGSSAPVRRALGDDAAWRRARDKTPGKGTGWTHRGLHVERQGAHGSLRGALA